MSKSRNFIIYIIVFVVIFASFKMPKVLLEFENDKIETAIYDKIKEKNKISVEAQNIYLVKAIHEIEEGNTIEISSNPIQMFLWEVNSLNDNTGILKNVNDEIKALEQYNILKGSSLDETAKYKTGVINKNYRNDDNLYTIKSIVILDSNINYSSFAKFVLNVESKTGKVIYINFDKNNIFNANNKREILDNYIKYLNLYIIDDWEYEEDLINNRCSMKSEKAGLIASIYETTEYYTLTFHVSN